MKTFCLALLTSTVIALPSHAGISWIGNAYVELNPADSKTQYYWVNQSDGTNPQFGSNLNGLSIHVGDSLVLGGQVQTWPFQYGVTVTMNYSIDNGAFTAINLPYIKTQNNNDWWENSAGANIGNNLAVGTHTLTVFYVATDGSTTLYDNADGANFSGSFYVAPVPEPAQWGLFSAVGLLGICGLRTWRQHARANSPSV